MAYSIYTHDCTCFEALCVRAGSSNDGLFGTIGGSQQSADSQDRVQMKICFLKGKYDIKHTSS